MKKRENTAINLEGEPLAEEELAKVIPIRIETTLTRYPFHRIAKKVNVQIKQVRKNQRGKTETTWEVRNPPGPLAYKLDTIIINRRIDEMRNRGEVRQLFKLGSLRDMCDELDINPNGKATNSIKEALKENALAGITAKIEFTGWDGIERTFEFTTTRYTVIFTGEKLPNGSRADSIYIELHPRYHEMLRHSKTRPLDYEYLRRLPPSAQRLYELLSFTIFGTLKHNRPIAQMLYSDFCKSAPLTRYSDWNKVRPQMWKIHKPHIDNKYIESVEFEESLDEEGNSDWIMKYTPGTKAKHEFREFSKKNLQGARRPVSFIDDTKQSKQLAKLSPAPETLLNALQQELVNGLCAQQVSEQKARSLVLAYPDRVERELEAFAYRDKSKMKDPAAWLIRAIENGDYSQPSKVEEHRQKKAVAKKEKERQQLEERYRGEYQHQYLRPLQAELKENHPEAASIYEKRCANWDNFFPDHPPEMRDLWKLSDLEVMAEEFPKFGFLNFWEWVKIRLTEEGSQGSTSA